MGITDGKAAGSMQTIYRLDAKTKYAYVSARQQYVAVMWLSS